MCACSPGSLRKYQTHTMVQPRLIKPRTINDPRHVTSAISQTTRGGVKAFPSRAAEWVIPWENPRFPSTVQSDIARVAAGNVAPSPNPSRTRAQSMLGRPDAKPVNKVASAQMTAETVRVNLAPKRSLTQPPMI